MIRTNIQTQARILILFLNYIVFQLPALERMTFLSSCDIMEEEFIHLPYNLMFYTTKNNSNPTFDT